MPISRYIACPFHHRYTRLAAYVSPPAGGVPATPSPQARGFASLSGVLLPPAGAVGPKMARNPFIWTVLGIRGAVTRPANRPRSLYDIRKG